jgi:hypothetical protein
LYTEDLEIKLVKQMPIKIYAISQSTYMKGEKPAPVHFESGFIKLLPKEPEPGLVSIEANFAHPFGV